MWHFQPNINCVVTQLMLGWTYSMLEILSTGNLFRTAIYSCSFFKKNVDVIKHCNNSIKCYTNYNICICLQCLCGDGIKIQLLSPFHSDGIVIRRKLSRYIYCKEKDNSNWNPISTCFASMVKDLPCMAWPLVWIRRGRGLAVECYNMML